MMIAFILLLFIHPAMSYTAISDLNFMTTKGNALQLFCTNQTLSESTYGPIENWNLKAVTNFAYMFSLQDSLGLPNNAARVQIITECCGRLKAADLSQWDVEGGLYLSFARPGPAFGLASEEFPFCEYRKPLCGEHWKKSKFLPDFNAYSSTNDLTLRPEYRQYFMDLFYCDGQLSNTNIKIAAADWVANSTEATKIWGPIADWNVSLVSQFDNLFPLEFNEDISKWDVSAASHSTVFSSGVDNRLRNLPNYQKFDNGRPLGMVNMFSKNAEYHVGADNFYMRLHPKTVSQFSHALCSEAWLSAPIQHLNVKDEVFLCDGIINSKNFALASKDYHDNYLRSEWWSHANYNKTNDLFLPTKPVGAAKWWGPIENWDVSRVVSMRHFMKWRGTQFYGNWWDDHTYYSSVSKYPVAYYFNADISKWVTTSLTDMATTFKNMPYFVADISKWSTGKVQSFTSTFEGPVDAGITHLLNPNISMWDVSNALYMGKMFFLAKSFNQELSGWDVAQVQYAQDMFRGTESFDKIICSPSWMASPVVDSDFAKVDVVLRLRDRRLAQRDRRLAAASKSKKFCCQVGEFYEDGLSCNTCPKGYVNGQVNIFPSCARCERDWIAPAPKMNACSECSKEKYSNTERSSCESCPAAKFMERGEEETECFPCQAGTFNDQASQVNCKSCPSGYIQATEEKPFCLPCLPGTFQLEDGTTACKSCPTGWVQPKDGTLASYGCDVCTAGQYSSEVGQPTCQACPTGQYNEMDGGNCLACPVGQYQDDKGESSCKACSEDRYGVQLFDSSNQQRPAVSSAECMECPKTPDQTTGGIEGSTSIDACKCPRTEYYSSSSECLPCPEGADCSAHDGITLAELVALPGFWRPNPLSTTFSSCAVGFTGTAETKTALAERTCCPLIEGTNRSKCSNLTFTKPEEQCLDGYNGALCLVCADGWVPQGDGCVQCEGGAQITLVFVTLFIACFVVYCIVVVVLSCSVHEEKVETAAEGMGQLKIVIAYIQIMASMPGVMESVPWPDLFVSFSLPFTAINFNFMSLFAASSCGLSVLFPQQFLVHMTMPVCLTLACLLAYCTSNICGKKTKEAKDHRKAQAMKIFFVLVNLIYPGLCTSVFTMFRCKTIAGVDDGQVLVADFSVRCGQGDHAMYQILAVVFGLMYIAGVPLSIFIALKMNRQHLYDKSSSKYLEVQYKLGGLYAQYDEEYWWFEIFIMVHKMFMTGAMCIIAAGTSAQPLVATLFQLAFLLVVLKLAPYGRDVDDQAAFIAALTLILTMICGFALMTDVGRDAPDFDPNITGFVMVAISILCLVLEIGIFGKDKCSKNIDAAGAADEGNVSKTKVTPLEVHAQKAWEM